MVTGVFHTGLLEYWKKKTKNMKIQRIRIDPDPYEPFRLAQGYRAGDFLFI
jgi:hypothetical protein